MAARYWVNGGNGNWNSSTNWSATSGGSSGASVPTASDDVYFDGNGNSDSTISANITVRSFIVESGFTSKITHNAVLRISGGNWTFNNSHTIDGSSEIEIISTTIDLNGQSWPNDLKSFGSTHTLNSDVTVLGTFSSNSTSNTVLNTSVGAILYANGLTVNWVIIGTATIELTGGTWSASNYVWTNLRLNGNITISGTVNFRTSTLTYISGTIITTGSTLNLQSSCTINTDGIEWNNVTSSGATITLTSDLTILGTLSSITASNTNINTSVGAIVYTNGLTHNSVATLGTATIELTGGVWTGTFQLRNNIRINGNVTISGTVNYNTGTITYISGTITTTGSTLAITGSATLNTDGVNWNNMSSTGGTITLTSDLRLIGDLSIIGGTNTTINTSVGAILYTNGLTHNLIALLGTATIELTGGNWTGTVQARNDIRLNGNVTISGTVNYNTGTITYVSGTITTTGSTLNLSGTSTLDTSVVEWENVITSNTGAAVYTLNSTFRVSGTFTTGSGNVTFAGSFGWEIGTFLCDSISIYGINLAPSIEYKINNLLDVHKSRNGSAVIFSSTSLTVKSILTLRNGALCKCLANFTRIDSSNGRTINTFSGTVTDCINVRQFFDLGTVGSPI